MPVTSFPHRQPVFRNHDIRAIEQAAETTAPAPDPMERARSRISRIGNEYIRQRIRRFGSRRTRKYRWGHAGRGSPPQAAPAPRYAGAGGNAGTAPAPSLGRLAVLAGNRWTAPDCDRPASASRHKRPSSETSPRHWFHRSGQSGIIAHVMTPPIRPNPAAPQRP